MNKNMKKQPGDNILNYKQKHIPNLYSYIFFFRQIKAIVNGF